MSFFNAPIKSTKIKLKSQLNFLNITEPSITTNKLYNTGGSLKWNGSFMTGSVNKIITITSTSHISIPSGTMGINIKIVGGGGGGSQGSKIGDIGGAGSSGSYTEIYLNPSTFNINKHGSNRSNIYVSIGSGGSTGSDKSNGLDGTNTIVRFSNGEITNGVIIATAIGGFGGYNTGLGPHSSICKGFGGTNTITGKIFIGIGYTIPGRVGFNGNITNKTINNKFGTYGGKSILGSPGYGSNKLTIHGVHGSRGGGGGGGFYNINKNKTGTNGGDGCAIITFY